MFTTSKPIVSIRLPRSINAYVFVAVFNLNTNVHKSHLNKSVKFPNMKFTLLCSFPNSVNDPARFFAFNDNTQASWFVGPQEGTIKNTFYFNHDGKMLTIANTHYPGSKDKISIPIEGIRNFRHLSLSLGNEAIRCLPGNQVKETQLETGHYIFTVNNDSRFEYKSYSEENFKNLVKSQIRKYSEEDLNTLIVDRFGSDDFSEEQLEEAIEVKFGPQLHYTNDELNQLLENDGKIYFDIEQNQEIKFITATPSIQKELPAGQYGDARQHQAFLDKQQAKRQQAKEQQEKLKTL